MVRHEPIRHEITLDPEDTKELKQKAKELVDEDQRVGTDPADYQVTEISYRRDLAEVEVTLKL